MYNAVAISVAAGVYGLSFLLVARSADRGAIARSFGVIDGREAKRNFGGKA
jgi:hypothetical protein